MLRATCMSPSSSSRPASTSWRIEATPIQIAVMLRKAPLTVRSTSKPGSTEQRSTSPASTTSH